MLEFMKIKEKCLLLLALLLWYIYFIVFGGLPDIYGTTLAERPVTCGRIFVDQRLSTSVTDFFRFFLYFNCRYSKLNLILTMTGQCVSVWTIRQRTMRQCVDNTSVCGQYVSVWTIRQCVDNTSVCGQFVSVWTIRQRTMRQSKNEKKKTSPLTDVLFTDALSESHPYGQCVGLIGTQMVD
jgi:hypothetical protein